MLSKPTINNPQPHLPSQHNPLHHLRAIPTLQRLALRLNDTTEQLPRAISILSDPALALGDHDALDGAGLQVWGRGSHAGHEEREDEGPAGLGCVLEGRGGGVGGLVLVLLLLLLRGEDVGRQGEDEIAAQVGVVLQRGAGGGGDQALAGEHGGAEVDLGGLVEEEGLQVISLAG